MRVNNATAATTSRAREEVKGQQLRAIFELQYLHYMIGERGKGREHQAQWLEVNKVEGNQIESD